MRPIVFLDIDGVLNIVGSNDFNRECVENLNMLIAATDAEIVVSSSWRVFHDFEDLCGVLAGAGVEAPIKDVTCVSNCHLCCRGNEIQDWIHDGKIDNYVIIDDSNDMLYTQKDNYVQINPYVGLTANDVRRCIEIINRKKS